MNEVLFFSCKNKLVDFHDKQTQYGARWCVETRDFIRRVNASCIVCCKDNVDGDTEFRSLKKI